MLGDFSARLRAHADRDPSRVALTFAPIHLDLRRVEVTYGEIWTESQRFARILASRFEPGERVLLLFPATPEFAVAFLGCLAAGVIAVPVPLPLDESAQRRVLNVARDCAVSAIISLSFVRELAAAGTPAVRRLCDSYQWLLLDNLDPTDDQDDQAGRPLPQISADHIAFLQYTSGSTSSPRGVMVSHGALIRNEMAIQESFGVTPDSTIVSWLPLHHDMGLIGGLLQPLFTGARGVVLDPLSFVRRPASWLEAISEAKADISGGPNFAYDLCTRKVSAAEKAKLDLSSWRVAFNGAAQVFPRTMRSFSEAFRDVGFAPSSHTPCYGLAEATLLVTSAATTTPVGTRSFSLGSLESGLAKETGDADEVRELVAYPLPTHASVRVVDPVTLEPVGDGRTGEIVVAGASNGSGYWGDPDGSQATFGVTVPGETAGPFVRTGDLGFVHRGDLFIEGRSKDLIVSRGRNLYPEDLEADISACDHRVRPGCGAVFGIEHDQDEAVVVCQEVREDTPPDHYPEVVAQIRECVSRIHGVTAHTVVLVPPRTVTKTSSGKIQRHAAKLRFLSGELSTVFTHTAHQPPAHAIRLADRLAASDPAFANADAAGQVEVLTLALREHLRDLLALPATPRGEDSLASLGADSMLAVQLQYAVEEALGIVLRPSAALRAASIADLATAAVHSGRTARPAPTSADDTDDTGYELTAAQRALWFLHQAFPDSTAYNVTRAFRGTGQLDVAALSAGLNAVVARHPSLRLSVLTADGEPHGVLPKQTSVEVELVDAQTWAGDEESRWYRTFATTPFDLERAPLLRAAVLRRAEDWLLVLSLHHIVCDVSSLAIIVADLAALYQSDPPPPAYDVEPNHGVSPAARERAVLSERGEELAAYWRHELDGELPTLALPGAGPATRGTGVSLSFTAPPALTSTLTRFARESGLTLHNVLLAAYQVLLHRLTGQSDLVVGVPTAGRGDRRLASWVGYLVNVLPIRSSFAPGAEFTEFAQGTQRRVFDALDHQELPLSHIIRLANPDRDSAAATIFQAMFSYYTTALPGGESAAAVVMGDPDTALSLGGCTLSGYPVADHTTQSDLGLNVAVRSGTLGFDLQYDVEKVSLEQANQLATTFLTLLTAIGERPSTEVHRLPLLTTDHVRALVAAGTGPAIARPGHYLDSFERMVDQFPAVCAADDGVVRLTYAELDQRANHIAAGLRERGVGIDVNVVMCAERSVDYLAALLGIHKADGCYVPISPTEAPRRAAAMVSAVAAVVAIAGPSGRALLTNALGTVGSADTIGTVGSADTIGTVGPLEVLDLAELAAGRSSVRPARISPDGGASTIIHTSGSTGVPKAAVSTNYGVTNHMWQMVEHFDLGPEDCVAQTGPVSFDISVWQLLTPLMIGARVRIIPEPASQSPVGLLTATREGGVSMLELVPSAIVALLDAGLADAPGALRVMLSTGEALTAEVPRRWVRELPAIPLHNAYGPAECTDDVTAGRCALGVDAPTTVSIGRPLANTSVLVLDADLRPVPVGVVGVLHVGGGAVGRGYRGDPRRTAQAFVPDPWSSVPGGRLYRTGDLARVAANGDIDFLGRADSQSKIRGLRIEAGEVEAALRECPGVVAAAVKVQHATAGASLVGYVVMGDPLAEARVLDRSEDERLRRDLAERLPRYMIPTILVRIPQLPRSSHGKVDYRALSYTAPAASEEHDVDLLDDPLSAAVRSIWTSLLGVDSVSWNDNFFQLGGHSLLALTMIDRVGKTLAIQLEVDTVFTHPSLRDFVEVVRRADPASPSATQPSAAWPSADRARDTSARPRFPAPASSAQQRFWFLHEMDPNRPTYNMPGVLRLHGVLDENELESALRHVLGRHPVLLASFSEVDGGLSWTPGSVDDFELPRLDLRGAVAEFGDEVFDRLVDEEANKVTDLRREFPFRALLARLGPKDWGLFVTIDHIVCDGWSLSVFLSDLAESYNRRIAGVTRPLPEYGYSFADYCHDERAWRQTQDQSEIMALWRGVADGPVSLSPLPTVAGPAGEPGAGRLSRWIDEDLADSVRDLAGRTGATPYMVFATALSTLVHRGTADRETILLGTLIAQRDRPEWRRVVGPLLNVSVLAVDLALTDTLSEALRRTRDGALRAYRSSHVPFQELVPLLSRATGDDALFDVMLVLQPADRPAEFDGLTTDLVDLDTGAAPYPLTVDIEAHDRRYRVSYRYATDRYAPADVEDLAARLHTALQAIVTDADRTVRELRSSTAALANAERNQ